MTSKHFPVSSDGTAANVDTGGAQLVDIPGRVQRTCSPRVSDVSLQQLVTQAR